jgi:hypothetical protein
MLAAVLTVLVIAPSAARALVRPVSADSLTRAAATVVLARATAVHSYLTPASAGADLPAIATRVDLRVFEVLKGTAAEHLSLTVPGGRVGDRGMTSPDAPSFERGLTYLIFLDAGGQIVAWRHGQPLVVGGRVPALGRTLAQLERRIAALTGRKAVVYARPAGTSRARGLTRPLTIRVAKTLSFVLPPGTGGGASGTLPAPIITAITPGAASAGTGTAVTISGSGFGATQGSSLVGFYYQADDTGATTYIAAPVVSWSDTAIVCTVPIGDIDDYAASAGTGPVVVYLNGTTYSAGYPFTVSFSYGGKQWPRNKCRFRVNAAGHGAWAGAVRAAAQTWTAAAAGKFRFIAAGTAPAGTSPVEDGNNDVVWGSGLPAEVIAAAWTYDLGRAILETDIMFNSAYAWGTSGAGDLMDVQSIATHELGHWLNLRDLYGLANEWGRGDEDKMMFGFSDYGVNKRALSAADGEGILWTYARERRDTQAPTSTTVEALKARRAQRVKLWMVVNDPEYSCGAAAVRIVIKDRGGRTVARVTGWGVPTNERTWIPYKCTLPRGTYRWYVQATDLAGRRQLKAGSNKLVVR